MINREEHLVDLFLKNQHMHMAKHTKHEINIKHGNYKTPASIKTTTEGMINREEHMLFFW